ncbi:RNA-binding S4 domain-containing protein [Thalassotalea sp. PS06]|uniref:RNA-binding S4 domain-containing protein n=1 Tax=Thalassotalea sp. PS06 TaxID=2594005 RepID=UPI0021B12E71|nr:RNA-binding S4 domain-containing protein [Thalassotalea sp. PS06]
MSDFIELDESDITTIDVYAEPLELYKLLKIANLVGGGGEAKMLIADGYVGVNGELCQQKRKKIYQGDLVEFNGEFMQIRLVDAPPQLKPKPKPVEARPSATGEKSQKNKGINNKAKSKRSSSKGKSDKPSDKGSRSGRRSISF